MCFRDETKPYSAFVWIAKLKGIRKQVKQDLLQLTRIGLYYNGMGQAFHMDATCRARIEVRDNAAHECRKIEASFSEGCLSAIEFRQIQQLINEIEKSGCIAYSRLNYFFGLCTQGRL